MPVWLPPLVIVIQGTVLVAVQEHWVPVMTLVDWTLDVDTVENVVCVTLYEHCAEASDASSIQISATTAQPRRIVMVPSGQRRVKPRAGGSAVHGPGRWGAVRKGLDHQQLQMADFGARSRIRARTDDFVSPAALPGRMR